MRLLLIAALAACAAGALAATAAATNECHGLQVCVPVKGPWILTPAGRRVEFQLSCPRRFVIGGLDAELTDRTIEIGFVGGLGSPVNPGITTSTAAVFLGRLTGAANPAASFRPHIGCIPGAGGGERVPTAYRVFPPGKPTLRLVKQLPVHAGTTRTLVTSCAQPERLAAATYAIAFYTEQPPTAAQARSVSVSQSVRSGRVRTSARGGDALQGVRAVVDVELVCAVGT